MKKILILTNSINGLYNFRKELIQKLYEEYKVVIVAPEDERTSYFVSLGCKCIDISINRRGTNPFSDFKLVLNYIKVLKAIEPDTVLTYTIKPNVYGGIACRLLKIPYIANITGLGTSIESKGLLQKVSLLLYKVGLKNANCVFFQNEANKNFFVNNRITNGKFKLVPGSGVNIEKFSFEEYPQDTHIIRFLFIGRIMKSKGIEELLQAAQKIKKKYINVQFDIIGRCEEDYKKKLMNYEKNKVIKYYGQRSNVHSYIKGSHAIIHPSHHEGMSNVLLESASTGRPVLASDIPACKETFDESVSGLGFKVKSVDSMVSALEKFINLPYEKKVKMGIAGRRKMEKEFDRNIVINAYMEEINQTLKER